MRLTRVLGALALLAATSCSYSSEPAGTGKTQVLLTDSPFPYDDVAQVNIHVVRVQTSPTADSVNASWTTVAEPDRTINILDLQAGTTTLLGEATLDANAVGAVRVVINTAQSSIIDTAGHSVPVVWPVNGEMPVNAYVQSSLADFVPGTPHNLVIDFDVGRSFEDLLGNGTLYFLSWIRALDDAGAGAIQGTIRGRTDSGAALTPVKNAAVTVLAGDPTHASGTWFKVATGRTDANGHYKVAYLLLGTYIVRVEPLGPSAAVMGCDDTTGVLVTAQQTATLNMDLPPLPGLCARHTGGGGGPDSNGVDTTHVAGAVENIVVGASPANPVVNDSVSVYAQPRDSVNTPIYGKTVTWGVSDTTVLSITGIYGNSLLLRARKTGTVTITARADGVLGSAGVTVH